MRPLDELARLWNDTCLRIQYCPRPLMIAAVSGVAALALIGTALSLPTANPAATGNSSQAQQATRCQDQTWPYLSGGCVRQDSAARDGAVKTVRVIPIEPGSTAGATPWTPTGKLPPRREVAGQEQPRSATRQNGRTVRAAAPRRQAGGSMDSAFRAYGQAR